MTLYLFKHIKEGKVLIFSSAFSHRVTDDDTDKMIVIQEKHQGILAPQF
jgi:hypothetical protein